MATWKYTMIFNSSTNVSGGSVGQRTGGWSEGLYSANAPTAEIGAGTYRSVFEELCSLRARLLPTGFAVVGQRYQQIDPIGGSATGGFNAPGSAGIQADVPQMALFLRLTAAETPNIKPLTLRGLPDARVVEGEYKPESTFTAALQAFVNKLNIWRFKGRDLTQTPVAITSIDANGLATLDPGNPFVPDDYVRVLRTTDINGDRQGGRFRVIAPITTSTVTLQGWDLGECHGGKMRLDLTIYPLIGAQTANVLRVIVRKVGRPFGQYRGRASTRR